MSRQTLGPQNLPEIMQVLAVSLSEDHDTRTKAHDTVKQMENCQGFCSALFEAVWQSNDQKIRFIAAIVFKNTVSRCWRRRQGSVVTDEEKVYLRSRLVELLLHVDEQNIALQVALLITKIARFDCPQQWPDLLPTLVKLAQSPVETQSARGLMCMHHVIKELAAKRLASDRKAFHQIAPDLLMAVGELWTRQMDTIGGVLSTGGDNTAITGLKHTAEVAILSTKVLSRLGLHGFPRPHQQEAPALFSFVEALIKQVTSLVPLVQILPENMPCFEQLDKLTFVLVKFILEFQKQHPLAFPPYLLPCTQFFYAQVIGIGEGRIECSDKYTIQCLTFLRNIVNCSSYRPPTDPAGASFSPDSKRRIDLSIEASQMRDHFLTPTVLQELFHSLIFNYFTLKDDDLSSWENEPENYVHEQDTQNWANCKRPCAENLYMTTLSEYSELAAGMVTQILTDAISRSGGQSMEATLARDACYLACGLGSYDLYNHIDFMSWWRSTLQPELGGADMNSLTGRIIIRRVIWLTGRWVEKLEDGTRPSFYSATLEAARSQDLVIKLTCLNTLKNLVDDFRFNSEEFVPFLPGVLDHIFLVFREAGETDTRLQMLSLLNVVIQNLMDKVEPTAGQILEALSSLWSGNQENIVKGPIVDALTHLVATLGAGTAAFHPILIPIISYCVNPENPDSLYVLDRGLELWVSTLRNCTEPVQALLPLVPMIFHIMESSSENTRVGVQILEMYTLLYKTEFMQAYASPLVDMFTRMPGQLNDKGTILTMGLLDTILQHFAVEIAPLLSNFLEAILLDALNQKESDLITGHYLCAFARLMFQAPEFLFQWLQQLSVKHQGQNLFSALLDIMLDKIDAHSNRASRRMSVVGLCSAIGTLNADVLQRVGGIIDLCVQQLYQDLEPQTNFYDYEALGEPGDEDELGFTVNPNGYQRQRMSMAQDPAKAVNVKELLSYQMNVVQTKLGDVAFNQLMESIDAKVREQLQTVLNS